MSRLSLMQRRLLTSVLLAAVVVLPPVLSRGATGLVRDHMFTLGAGVSFIAMALSLNLLMGYAGQISLGHGALLGVGAYTSGILTGRYGLAFVVGIAAAIVLGGAVAFVVGLPALRLRGLYLAITTIGFMVMMERSIFQIGWLTRGSAGVELPRPVAGNFVFNNNGDYLALLIVLLIAIWLVDRNVLNSKLGRAFHGIREGENIAQSFGVDTSRYKLIAFVISGSLAGVAGAMYGHLIRFTNSAVFDYDLSLLLVAFVVIGGLGSRVGVAVAAGSFAIVPRLLQTFEGWDFILGAALLIYAMARHPSGVAGAIKEAREAKAAKRARQGKDVGEEEKLPRLPSMPRPAELPARAETQAGRPLLEVRDVTVRFGGLAAVDSASLEVPRGKIVGLIGPNGAGKTTLFNAISGFVRADSGRVRFLGEDLTPLSPHERARLGIGRTFQLVGLAKNLSVKENLLLAQHTLAGYGTFSAIGRLPQARRTERELNDRADEALAALGFERYAEAPVKHLSGGQQRIVEMACALVTAPELLMLDEPSAGMAPAVVESLADRLRDVRDELGRTILLIEHHIPLVLDVCDEVYVLASGSVLAHGTPSDIVQMPDVVSAYLGSSQATLEVPSAGEQSPRTRTRRRVRT